MSQSVEWARTSSSVSVEDDPDWTDPYGQGIDEGNIGVWLDEVLIEGTKDEIRDLGMRLIALVSFEPAPVSRDHER